MNEYIVAQFFLTHSVHVISMWYMCVFLYVFSSDFLNLVYLFAVYLLYFYRVILGE